LGEGLQGWGMTLTLALSLTRERGYSGCEILYFYPYMLQIVAKFLANITSCIIFA
jgi:hypothetical protein